VDDNEVVFIDATTGTIADSFADCTNDSTIYDTEISPDGTILACASGSAASGYINLWEIDTHQYIGILRGHPFGMSDIDWSPDGQILASSSFGDRDILLWNVSTKELSGSLLGQLSDHSNGVTVIAYHPYEPILASGSGDESVTLWNTSYNAIVDLQG
jgi:WD40 repeat protein